MAKHQSRTKLNQTFRAKRTLWPGMIRVLNWDRQIQEFGTISEIESITRNFPTWRVQKCADCIFITTTKSTECIVATHSGFTWKQFRLTDCVFALSQLRCRKCSWTIDNKSHVWMYRPGHVIDTYWSRCYDYSLSAISSAHDSSPSSDIIPF